MKQSRILREMRATVRGLRGAGATLPDSHPMATVTVQIPSAMHRQLKRLAKARHLSVSTLIEGWVKAALRAGDAEPRYRGFARRGHTARGLALLDELVERQTKAPLTRARAARQSGGGEKR